MIEWLLNRFYGAHLTTQQIRATPRWPTQPPPFRPPPAQYAGPYRPYTRPPVSQVRAPTQTAAPPRPTYGQSGLPIRQLPSTTLYQRQGTYKYTQNVRNQPQPSTSRGTTTITIAQPALRMQGHEPLTASVLAAAPSHEQKQMIGERLFPLIQRMYPDMAGKITGMLLEIDNSELLHMLEHNESLKAKVEEAVAVLQAHQAKQHAAAQLKKE